MQETRDISNICKEYLRKTILLAKDRQPGWMVRNEYLHPLTEKYGAAAAESSSVILPTLSAQPSSIETLVDEALKLGIPREEAGYIAGAVLPFEYKPSKGLPPEFVKGLTAGQIVTSKYSAQRTYLNVVKTLALGVAGVMLTRERNPELTLSSQQQFSYLFDFMKIAAPCSLAYAHLSVIMSGLFSKDLNTSRKLRTKGVYALHRNPMWAGHITAALALAAPYVYEGLASIPANYLPAAISAATLSVCSHLMYKKVRAEEKHLEKEFGEEYEQYVARVPRFLPVLGHIVKYVQRIIKRKT